MYDTEEWREIFLYPFFIKALLEGGYFIEKSWEFANPFSDRYNKGYGSADSVDESREEEYPFLPDCCSG
jgi:hypothetical protein